MSICKPSCVTGLPNFGAIDDCDIISSLSSGEITKIILVKCDQVFDDVDDASEWTAAIGAGNVSIPFVGNGKIDEQTESGDIRIGCESVMTICRKPFEFTSYITDTAAQTEWSLYNQILAQRLGLSVGFLTCDGVLLIDPDWTSGSTIGIAKSSLKVSQVFNGEADGKMFYKISGELNECRSLKRVKLTQSTIDAIEEGQGSGG